MVKVEDAVNAQVIPVTDEQDRLIWPLKPPTALALIVRFVDPPAVTVAL